MTQRLTVLSLIILTALLGCTSTSGPPLEVPADGLNPAILNHAGELAEATVPKTATAGEPFAITVRTFLLGNSTSPGEIGITQSEGGALVEPLDTFRLGGLDVLRTLSRDVELYFANSGVKYIVVRGRASEDYGRVVSQTFRVLVQPSG